MGGLHVLNRLTRQPAQVLITNKGMQVKIVKSDQGFEVDWLDVATYKDAKLNGGRELRLRTQEGRQLVLPMSDKYLGEYFELVRAVEEAIAAFNQRHLAVAGDGQPRIVERKEFFATPVGRVVLLGLLLLPPLLLLWRYIWQE